MQLYSLQKQLIKVISVELVANVRLFYKGPGPYFLSFPFSAV